MRALAGMSAPGRPGAPAAFELSPTRRISSQTLTIQDLVAPG
ncbi:hypothetical protein FMEAI12_6980002 [Parafrankia sp. Ea1.12]|nr:hypothetical protein FMEAI12_6980002 [Parafrankia sp. Ea1.12]